MITINQGESGYFSRPVQELDPHLFDGTHLKPEVRTRLENLLFSYLATKYVDPESWTMVWLAGSGISYQWAAARGNGDLDVLFGIDYTPFVTKNPQFQYMDRSEIAQAIDNDLHINLWPKTAHEPFYADDDYGHIQYYEVTFFLSADIPFTMDGIVNIHPYAAYNVSLDQWTVKPAKNPVSAFPQAYADQADLNYQQARAIVDRYNGIKKNTPLNPGEIRNQELHLQHIRTEASNMFDAIHLGRKNAFGSQGEGFGDFYNYQWQRAKQDGIVTALKEIIGG